MVKLIIKYCFLSVALILALIAIFGVKNANAADEVPAFFLKIAKNIPRIGRSEKYDDFFDKSSYSKEGSWYGNGNPAVEVTKRKVGFSPESDTYGWQNFPLAIEGPPELWRTLAGYSRDPLYRTTDDFNNELWSRDKRTGDPE